MWRATRAAPVSVLVFVLALVLSCCGGGDSVAPTADAGSEPTDAIATTSTAAAPAAQTLEEFFGWGDIDPEAEQQRWMEQETRVQEIIVECMAEEGFPYTPMVPGDETWGYGPGVDLTEEEWTAKYGYGRFTMMLEEAEMMEGGEPPWEQNEDPNWAYMETLSEAQRQAYERALYGDHETWWEEHEDEIRAAEDAGEEYMDYPTYEDIGGCETLAWETVGMGPNEELEEAWRELDPYWEELYQRIEADARIVEANTEWSGCMAEAGYDFATQEDIWKYLDEKMQELWDWEEEGPPMTEAPLEGEEGEWSPFPPGVTEGEVRVLADEELEIAAADLACRSDLDEVYDEVRKEYEAQFILEHQALLERVREAEQAWRG
jgi:hypothetical protein